MVHQWLTNDHVPRNESYVAFQLTTAHRDQSTHYGIYYRASNFFIDEKDGERYHYPDVAQWKYSKMKIKKNPRVPVLMEKESDATILRRARASYIKGKIIFDKESGNYFLATGENLDIGWGPFATKQETEQWLIDLTNQHYPGRFKKTPSMKKNPRIKKNPDIHIDIGSHNATRSKRVRTNPKPPAARDLDQAKKLFRGFTGEEPQGVTRLKIKPFSTGLAIGKILAIIYEVSATGEKLKHSFKDSARPHLIVSSDGHQVLICGGKFTFTSRGFVDK